MQPSPPMRLWSADPEIIRSALQEKSRALGLGKKRLMPFPGSHARPGASGFITNAFLDKTLEALSFWKPEVCENKEREQWEPFTAACLTREHFFSPLAHTGHAVPNFHSLGIKGFTF